jgi:sporulation protein YlmC with PRC-barrel domain
MKEVRNADGKLVATIEEKTGTVIIIQRGCVTKLHLRPDGTIEIINAKDEAA